MERSGRVSHDAVFLRFGTVGIAIAPRADVLAGIMRRSLVVDGTGNTPFRADVTIKDSVSVGKTDESATRPIDATELVRRRSGHSSPLVRAGPRISLHGRSHPRRPCRPRGGG